MTRPPARDQKMSDSIEKLEKNLKPIKYYQIIWKINNSPAIGRTRYTSIESAQRDIRRYLYNKDLYDIVEVSE